MLSAIIIDDEHSGAETLSLLLGKHCPEVKVTGIFNVALDGAEAIRSTRPDVVFLDIEMPFANGFDVLDKVADVPFSVIFTTAYDQYAIKAIRFSALDYLLKPVDAEELKAAVKRVTEKKDRELPVKKQLEALITNLSSLQKPGRIAIHGLDGISFVQTDHIIRLEADSNYTHIHLKDNRKLTVARTLKEFEDLLEGRRHFFRVHNTHIINLDHVLKYMRSEGGYLLMSDGAHIEVSRRRKDELLELLTGR